MSDREIRQDAETTAVDKAERAVLASVLIDENLIAVVSDRLTVADFSLPAHERIYAAMLQCWRAGTPPDIITIPNAAPDVDIDLLNALVSEPGVRPFYIEHYAEVVSASARKRRRTDLLSLIALANHRGDMAELTRLTAEMTALTEAETSESSDRLNDVDKFRGKQERPFPVDVLPDRLARYITTSSEASGIPVDFIALPALTLIAGLIGNSAELVLKRNHVERPIVWSAGIGKPGSGKSPGLDMARVPAEAIQQREIDVWKARVKEWDGAPKEERGPRPELRNVYLGDTTIERVASAHEVVPGFSIIRDEIISWAAGFDRYKTKASGERQSWLSTWASSPIKVDRQRADPIYVPRPCVSVFGGIQPDLLLKLRADAADDGFLDRFLIAWPDYKPIYWSRATVDERTAEDYGNVFAEIEGAFRKSGTTHEVRLSAKAVEAWIEWHDRNADVISAANGVGAGFASKLVRHIPRLALILHISANPHGARDSSIHSDTLDAAIELGEFFRVEHGRMLAAIGAGKASSSVRGPVSVADRVVRFLKRNGGTSMRRDVMNGLRASATDLDLALQSLEERGVITRETVKTSTKPGERIFLVSMFESSTANSDNQTFMHSDDPGVTL